jgi:hypothetical protein
VITIQPHSEGATIAVRAQPGAKKNAVVGEHAGSLKIAVTAPPEEGRANEALIEYLKDWLGVKRSQIELLSGHIHRNKVFLIRGRSVEQMGAILTQKIG